MTFDHHLHAQRLVLMQHPVLMHHVAHMHGAEQTQREGIVRQHGHVQWRGEDMRVSYRQQAVGLEPAELAVLVDLLGRCRRRCQMRLHSRNILARPQAHRARLGGLGETHPDRRWRIKLQIHGGAHG